MTVYNAILDLVNNTVAPTKIDNFGYDELGNYIVNVARKREDILKIALEEDFEPLKHSQNAICAFVFSKIRKGEKPSDALYEVLNEQQRLANHKLNELMHEL